MATPQTPDHLIILAEMGREEQVRSAFERIHPADTAEVLDAIEEDELCARLFADLPTSRAAAVLSLVGDHTRDRVLDQLPEERLRAIVASLESDDAADLLAELPRAQVERLLQSIPARISADVRDLMRYDEDSAGGIMQREFVAVRVDASVEDAIAVVRQRAASAEGLLNVFVVDARETLVGTLPLRSLIL